MGDLMTIKTKLRAIFLVFISLLCILFFYNNNTLRELETDLFAINDRFFPARGALNNILIKINRYRALEGMHITSINPSTMDSLESSMEVIDNEVTDLHNKLLALLNLDEIDENNQLLKLWNQYRNISKNMLPISRKISDDHPEFLHQANQIFNKDSLNIYEKMIDITSDLVNRKTQQVKVLTDDNTVYIKNTINHSIIVLVASLLISVIVVALFEKQVIYILLKITDLMKKLADGDSDIIIIGKERSDEIGDIAKALDIFRKNAKEKEQLEIDQKNLAIQAEKEKAQTKQKMAKDFETSIQSIITMVASAAAELSYTSENMQKIIGNVNTEASEAAASSSRASSNVVAVAAAVEEMSFSIKEVSTQVSKTSVLMSDAVGKTSEANQSVAMLTSAVNQISNILEMIDGIAKQINLLALNATIESARAGDAGKGFAVVASEIKALADQTAKATETINQQITNIAKVSEVVANALHNIKDSVANVNQYAVGIAASVEEQSAATNEISSNMQRASQDVQHITNNVGVISKGSSEADNAAKEVLDASKMLSQQSETLKAQVQVFLKNIQSS
jgi:methyl-accepting chemotaxis protein